MYRLSNSTIQLLKGALQLLINRYGSIRFAQIPERVSTTSFVVLTIGNSRSNHFGAQGTLKTTIWHHCIALIYEKGEIDALGVKTIYRGCSERCCSNKKTPPYPHSNRSVVALRNRRPTLLRASAYRTPSEASPRRRCGHASRLLWTFCQSEGEYTTLCEYQTHLFTTVKANSVLMNELYISVKFDRPKHQSGHPYSDG